MGGLDGGGELGEVSVMAADALAAALGVHIENGLAAPEAARRLAQNGPNELRGAPQSPAWRRVLTQFQDPLIYLLLAAVAVALVAWWVEGPRAGRAGWPVDESILKFVRAHVHAARNGFVLSTDRSCAISRWARIPVIACRAGMHLAAALWPHIPASRKLTGGCIGNIVTCEISELSQS